jgi:hypothetical protein
MIGMEERSSESKKFYIQDTRQYVGNCVYWWAKESKGYTCHLDNAMQVEEKEAREIEQSRGTDKAWPVEAVDAVATRQVDIQRLRHDERGY